MAFNLTELGGQIATAFGVGLFGNEIFIGLFVILVAVALMAFMRMGIEGGLAILIGFVIILNDGGYLDITVRIGLLVVVGFLFASGIARKFRNA